MVRHSPVIGPKIPVHGLLVDIQSGKLEWLVNGYQTLATMSSRWEEVTRSAGQTVDALKSLTNFNIGEMKFPETKIGETVTQAEDWLAQKIHKLEPKPESTAAAGSFSQKVQKLGAELVEKAPVQRPPTTPPKIPLPPPIRPRIRRLR